MKRAPRAAPPAERLRARVRGAVQGVGFRPFVHRLATELRLSGFVGNDGEGVVLEVEGREPRKLIARMLAEVPRLARISACEVEPVAPRHGRGFSIRASTLSHVTTRIVVDAAPCPACLAELFDPASRFHLHPFITCTECGPRYTIARSLPYDRSRTTMAGFALCADCARAYADPRDRRFHAEPIACPRCGPRLSHSPMRIAALLRQGAIVALKGVGGYQLLCDATNPAAVATLRMRKNRPTKPFALLALNVASLRPLAAVSPVAINALEAAARPIVLLARAAGAPVADAVAPGLDHLGLMLPATPLHYLVLHALAGAPAGTAWLTAPLAPVLVATSGNIGGEPLIADDAEACERLSGIADLVVTHDRPIHARADDSVVLARPDGVVAIRRARGFVPDPIELAADGPCIVATGGLLKTTLCITRGQEAFLSPHIGTLDTPAAIRLHAETLAHMLRILDVAPAAVAHDCHPDFATTHWALAWARHHHRPAIAVQHHHAHLAAVLAEHRIGGPALGLILDGNGLGADGTAWGGEVLLADGAGAARRLGHLAPIPLPGGDRAVREPWRIAAGVLARLGRASEIAARFPQEGRAPALARLLAAAGTRLPATSSCGRLFDAAAALLGLVGRSSYEAEAAMRLEAACAAPAELPGGYTLLHDVVDFTPLLAHLADLGAAGAAGVAEGAALFHGTLAAGLVALARQAALASGQTTIALGGGCLLNRHLRDALSQGLAAASLVVLQAAIVPPNDGGLALGQAAVAHWHLAARTDGGS